MNPTSKTANLLYILVLIALLLSACGGAGNPPAPVTPTAGASPALTGEPQAGSTGEFDWLRITLPPGWTETAPGQYQGADGYARLELLDSQGAGQSALCMVEANGDKPNRYGAYPEIRDLTLGVMPACLILPSADQPADRQGEALYLLRLPGEIRADGLLAMHADRAHIEGIVESLDFARPFVVETTIPCDFSITGSPVETTQQGSLRMDAFPIARAGCSPYNEAAAFHKQVEKSAAGTRAEQIKGRQFQGERMSRLNAKLAPFGFKVETYDNLFRVARGKKLLRDNLSWVGQVSVREDGQDFIFPVLDGYNATAYMIRPDGAHALDEPDLLIFDQVFPVYAGMDRIELLYNYVRYPRPYSSPALLEIRMNGALIDTLSVSGANPAKGPVRGLWPWQDAEGKAHWTLETAGLVIEDGESLNERLDTPEILTWRLLKEKPFTMYRKDGQVRLVYDGAELPEAFDEVIAEPQFGDRLLIQMKAYESAMVFYAKKDGIWYLVVIEVE